MKIITRGYLDNNNISNTHTVKITSVHDSPLWQNLVNIKCLKIIIRTRKTLLKLIKIYQKSKM